jgi:hypothetical protein
MTKNINQLITEMDEPQFIELCDHFFKVLSKNHMNRVPGVYHPNNQIVEIAQNRGILCLPAHFYSPIPTKEEIRNYNEETYITRGIDWNDGVQLEYLNKCREIQDDLLTISINKINDTEFYWDNNSFSHSDAAFYYSLIQQINPNKIFEIGAGNSTKLAISSLLKNFDSVSSILSVIEPYPSMELIETIEKNNVSIIKQKIQDVPIEYFQSLRENDILFYDGSHVSKYGSDVNYFIFNVLPHLNSGVFIHIHDIFLPYDMPKKWVDELNLFWNEQYLIHAFLMYNQDFEIIFSSRYLASSYKHNIDTVLTAPLRHMGNGGGSIWLRKK